MYVEKLMESMSDEKYWYFYSNFVLISGDDT